MEYRNSDMALAIEEYVHNTRYREMLRMRYCEGMTYEEIAEAVDYSTQHIKTICYKYKELLYSHL